MPQTDSVLIENTRILFPNFSGREGEYNREGDRGFNVVLPMELAIPMKADGWNVKNVDGPRDEEDEKVRDPHLHVKVSYRNRPPKIFMIGAVTGRRNELDESMVGLLDQVEIVSVDLIINPYHWAIRGDVGISAYLKTMFVKIYEDALEVKYAEDDF